MARGKRGLAGVLAVAALAVGCSGEVDGDREGAEGTAADTTVNLAPLEVPLVGDDGQPVIVPVEGSTTVVHDPAVALEDGRYHLFSTGTWIDHRVSTDLVTWESVGSLFDERPAWVAEELGYPPDNLWAPDISFWGGQWHLYYSASEWRPDELPTRNSAIAHATSPTLDPDDPAYGWVDHGPVVRSEGGLTGDRSGFNAIDPTVVLDADGRPWLAWGSGFEGLFLQPLRDDGTVDDTVEAVNLARREDHPVFVVEAPTLVRRGDWWYLFASYDLCCAGVRSNYNVRVGRSRELTGPYVDRDGRPLTEGGGTKILSAYGDVLGPGHQTVVERDGRWWLVHHWYDGAAEGVATLGIRPLDWSDDGWPTARGWSEAIALPGVEGGRP